MKVIKRKMGSIFLISFFICLYDTSASASDLCVWLVGAKAWRNLGGRDVYRWHSSSLAPVPSTLPPSYVLPFNRFLLSRSVTFPSAFFFFFFGHLYICIDAKLGRQKNNTDSAPGPEFQTVRVSHCARVLKLNSDGFQCGCTSVKVTLLQQHSGCVTKRHLAIAFRVFQFKKKNMDLVICDTVTDLLAIS